MSGVLATTTVASCSTPSRTLCAASSGGLRPSLTAPAHNALASSDRNEETPRFNQTKKHHRQKPKPLLHSLTDTTISLLGLLDEVRQCPTMLMRWFYRAK